MPAWLVTTTTGTPTRLQSAITAPAPGIITRSRGSCRYAISWLMTPSRSRNSAARASGSGGTKQPSLHVVAQDVPDHDVRLLDPRCLPRRHRDHHVGVGRQRLPVL